MRNSKIVGKREETNKRVVEEMETNDKGRLGAKLYKKLDDNIKTSKVL